MKKIVHNPLTDTDGVFIVAELSANHNGSLEIAKDTIRAAKRAGVDAVKLQTYTADTITLKSNRRDFLLNHGTLWDGKQLHELYEEAYTPWEWHKDLFDLAKEEGLICFSTPFDFTSVDFLEKLENPIYKIASFEITDIPLIQYVASKGKPIIISTGIASLEDIELAINTCRDAGNNQITLLKCTSSYPAPIDEANLVMIKEFAEKFNINAGLSDHTLGVVAPIIAVSQGAKVIEKHIKLDNSIQGPDTSFSLNEQEFTIMVNSVRQAEVALGKVDYNLTSKQIQGKIFSRSLYIVKDVNKGDLVTKENIRSIRPGHGLHPKYFKKIMGKKFSQSFSKGERLSLDMIQ